MRHHREIAHLVPAQDTDVEFAIFLESFREYERHCQLEEAQDAFLDAYSAWRKSHDPAMKAHVILCAAYLRTLDPSFRGPSALRRYYLARR